jgi:hypothetical protein
MLARGPRVLAIVFGVVVSGCGFTAPTPVGYAGQWSGTTAQGKPIAFTVSADDKVTSITVEHSFNGCSGSQTFSNLNLETAPNVTCIPGPCPPTVASYRAFHYAAGARSIDGPSTSVNGLFLSMATAQGAVGFLNYPGCGTALGVGWTAIRR